MPWQVLRTVVEEHRAADSADRFEEKFARFDEAYTALKWLLARSGHTLGLWQTINGTQYRIYVQASDRLAKTPELWVIYTCSDDEVVIYEIEAREPDTEQ